MPNAMSGRNSKSTRSNMTQKLAILRARASWTIPRITTSYFGKFACTLGAVTMQPPVFWWMNGCNTRLPIRGA